MMTIRKNNSGDMMTTEQDYPDDMMTTQSPSFDDIMTMTEDFKHDVIRPLNNRWYPDTPRAMFAGSIFYIIAVLMYLTGRRNLMHGKEFGTAEFADIEQVNHLISDKDESKNRILSEHVRMSMDTKVSKLNNNLLVIGGSGAGKTFFMVKPNIMQLMPKGSFIATDPKGELLRATGGMLKKNGYNVKVLNLIDMAKSDGYNPFRYIRTENDVVKLVTNLISNTTPKESSPSDPFWEHAEGMFLQALFYYVWLEMPPNRRNFQSVLMLLSEAEVTEKKESKLTKRMNKLLDVSPLGENHPAYRQYMKVIRGAGDTVRSIIISANSRLALLENPQILRILAKDDLKIEELGIGTKRNKSKRTALFCVIPDSDKSYNFIVGLLYTQLFQELYYQADFKFGGKLPLDVTLMLDEFANVALPDDFCSVLSTMRSRKINAVIIIQNLAQIKALFKDTWETITGNCDTLVYLGGNEKSTHEYISELLGKATIDKRSTGETRGMHGSSSRNYDVLGRSLMNPDEVRNMDNSKCLIFIKGFKPIFDEKFRPFGHPNFSQTEDGGAKPYVHRPSKTKKLKDEMKIYSEAELKEEQKNNKNINVMDVTPEEMATLDEREFQKGCKPPEEDLRDELTTRISVMDFSDEQMVEINKAIQIPMDLNYLLEYLLPETPVEEMEKKRKQYLDR
ncbi:MAG: type IV secretory system conjugative DNA transfer family protein [Lachnospiraceae bacterium]|nr:type IV secretory system conjugative DNA transfer family protein [Lachnospiraceae bacterium]